MPRKSQNLVGKKFGKLEVIEFAGFGSNGRQQIAEWLCKCDCGNTCVIAGYLLQAGRKKSCGCLRISTQKLVGMQFGKLTILGEDKDQSTTLRKVICRCECGNTKSIAFRDLKNGKVTSCGCDRTQIPQKQDYFVRNYDAEKEKKRRLFAKGEYDEICTLEEWVYIWLRDVQPRVIKQSTLLMYGETMERHILPSFGGMNLKAITAFEVSRWLNRLRVEEVPGTINEKMTEGTVRNTLSVLSGCMRDAQKYGLIEKNPCLEPAWIVPAKNLNESRDWLDEGQVAALEPLLSQYRNEQGYPIGVGFQLVLYTGLFMSEAVALRWKDIDFSREILTVHSFVSLTKSLKPNGNGTKYRLEPATGRREREVPIPEFFAKRLLEIQEQFESDENTFVVNPYDPEPMRLDRMRSALLRKGNSAGIKKITPQKLRDTYAMRAVHAGATSDVIAELMGFASPQQVVRRYMPKAAVDKRELVNRMYG